MKLCKHPGCANFEMNDGLWILGKGVVEINLYKAGAVGEYKSKCL
jgi:hypothetical protein